MASNYQNFQFNGQNGTNNQPIGQNINPIPNFQPNYFFPQPIGNVYSLNSSADIANIPIGANLSVGLCLNENMIYIKSMQNGAPVTLSYHLTGDEPINTQKNNPIDSKDNNIEEINRRLSNLESYISKFREKNGGKIEWQA